VARIPYVLPDGSEIPSVTTIINRFQESGGLIHWAWKIGKSGGDYREASQGEASVGTHVHRVVEWDILGRIVPTIDIPALYRDRVKQSFESYLSWKNHTRLEMIRSEVRLISTNLRFGGTIDGVARIDGKRSILDWKTSRQVYSSHLIQLAAYGLLWDSAFPDQEIEGGFHLLRFDKNHGDFHHHHYQDLSAAVQSFLLMRRLFDLDQELKERAR
jgi:hypothetical protein